MTTLRDWSIRKKLTFITMLTSSVALVVACAAFGAYDYTTIRRLMVRDIETHADIVGANCSASILFDDAGDAAGTLASLAAKSNVVSACIRDASGRELADYRRRGAADASDPTLLDPGTHQFTSGAVTVTRAIRLDGNVVGTITVRSDLTPLYSRVRSYGFVLAVVMVAASVTAWLLVCRLQRLISTPILHLAQTARRVTADKDYSGRAEKIGNDELGALIECFNEMLGQIQRRDAELEAHRGRLEEEVAQRTAELVTTNAQLTTARDRAEQANRAKSAFLANMSHEIRTPMTAIVGYADMMLDPDQTLSDRQDSLQIIRRNARHLLDLIGDILDLSKIEADKMTVEHIDADLAQIVSDVVSLMRPRAMDKGLLLSLTFGKLIPRRITSDPLRLKQVLMNLMGNAIKFTNTGSVQLHVACEPNAEGKQRVRIDVTDTGIGMSAEQIARLFQPFAQADESMTRRFGGTGLGLIISKRLAELLGGDISVRSQPGKGSTFTITIDPGSLEGVEMLVDLQESMVAPSLQPFVAKELRLTGRILLAEDGLDNQRLISTHLRKAGADVIIAENGRVAVDLVREQSSFDVILMDMQMPELDGYGAASELRRRGCTTPIIALTAHAMAGDREKCLAAGCTDYLTKPVERDLLIGTIAAYQAQAKRGDGNGYKSGAAAATAAQTVADVARANRAAGNILRSKFAGDPDMDPILAEFVAGLPAQVSTLLTLTRQEQAENLRRVVHQLKGTGGGYGFAEITTIAARAEAGLKAGCAIETMRSEIDALVALVRRVDGYDISKEQFNHAA